MGTGGWAYFPVGQDSSSKLKAYSKVFNFVEVNYTFYEYPSIQAVEYWRRIVPKAFVFSVRCHQDLTHKTGLKPISEAYRVLNQMITYCVILDAPFLVLETPCSYTFADETVRSAQELLASVNFRNVRIAWENRSPLTVQAQRMMEDLNIVHAVDLSRQTPLFPKDVIYTRLFGKGKHNIYQFTDEELAEIDHKVSMSKAKSVSLSYHGVRMNTDAARFVTYKKTGKFPSITGTTGAASAKIVLSEDVKFPTSRQALIADQGWKVFDATEDKRIHLWELLQKIPEKTYANLAEVTHELEAI